MTITRPFVALVGAIMLAHAAFAANAALAGGRFRWAGEGDAGSLDPYSRNEILQLSLIGNVYEPLIRRAARLALEPALALAWEPATPTRWRFHLRPQVKWQDGSPFTAADVLFSLHRVQSQASMLRSTVWRITGAIAVDDLTVDFETATPDPVLPEEITTWYIMSRAWSERQDTVEPALLANGAENYATRHAMGTGPFSVTLREPDRRTDLERNPLWWDGGRSMIDHAEYVVLGAATTRVAALVAGDVDMITGVPPQDAGYLAASPGLKLLQGPELRTIFLGMDQSRPELLKSDVKGANPFRDLRVREAVALAIDETTIARKVMRGLARPAWLLWGPGVNGYDPDLDHRPAPDPDRARALLAEAGYKDGFGLTIDCPNDRYVMDEAICTSLVPMLARVGIRLQVNAQPKARFFAEVGPPDYHTSFYLIGWTPPTYDALNVLTNLAGTRGGTRGAINYGGYSNPKVDDLIGAIGVAADPAARLGLIADAAKLLQQDFAYVPLHQQVLLWGCKDTLDVPQSADGFLQLRLVDQTH